MLVLEEQIKFILPKFNLSYLQYFRIFYSSYFVKCNAINRKNVLL
jgi:hypothetical protein